MRVGHQPSRVSISRLRVMSLIVSGTVTLLGVGTHLHSAQADVAPAQVWAGLNSADGGHVTQPQLVREAKPRFPPEAKDAGVTEATVLLMVIIGTDGHPRDSRVALSTHPGLGFETAALRAVKRWRYRPALQDGEPVAVYFYVEVRFRRPET